MIATDYDRDDCLLGRRRITYARLQQDYRCNGCGGRIVGKFSDDEGWHVECGQCGGRDFIHIAQYECQEHEAVEVLAGLPANLAALLRKGDRYASQGS